MSGAKLLDFGANAALRNLDFADLEKRLEKRLYAIKSLPDLEKLIKLMNPLLKADRYSTEEQTILKRLRQRAYDRRRNPKFQITTSALTDGSELSIHATKSPAIKSANPKPLRAAGLPMPTTVYDKKMINGSQLESFSEGALRALSSINGEHFVKTAPRLLAWFFAAALVSFFLWQQSLTLYETAGFTNAIYSAAGGVVMIVGFAAYYAIARSWLALFLCIYAGAYEGYLMVSGTIHDDVQTQTKTVQGNPEFVFLQEKATKELATYHDLKQRYDNPESKVFKNEWFSKNHVNPAWGASVKAHEDVVAKKVALVATATVEHVTWLKIFYRLGLVFLCMVLVHRFFASCVGKNAS